MTTLESKLLAVLHTSRWMSGEEICEAIDRRFGESFWRWSIVVRYVLESMIQRGLVETELYDGWSPRSEIVYRLTNVGAANRDTVRRLQLAG